jgi:pimeloyl-ACP methyl ester carboxylesterase
VPTAELGEFHPFRSAEARDCYLAHYDAMQAMWPVASEMRLVSTGYGETFVRISGPAAAPPLVLLPGNRSHSLYWFSLVEVLSERFRTYAVDAIYDVGRSLPTRPIASVSDLMGWLDGLLDALGLSEGVNLMGFSFGGWLTAEYALHAQDRLAKVVWLSPGGVAVPATWGFIARAMLLMVPSRMTFGAFLRWLMPDALRLGGDARDHYDRGLDDMVVSARCFSALKFVPGAPRVLTDAELRSIGIPVLYMVGARDRMCSATAAADRLRSVMPGTEVEVYPDAGHDLLFVHPEAISRRAVQFLQA